MSARLRRRIAVWFCLALTPCLVLGAEDAAEGPDHAPWWTLPRATLALAFLGLGIVGGAAWSESLRRRVEAQRRELAAELAERVALERRYRELTEAAPDAIYTLDATGRILSANPACAALTGYPETELRSMSVVDLVPPGERERVRARLAERFTGTESVDRFEVRVLTRDGQYRAVEVASRVVHPSGEPARLEGIARDVSDRRRSEELLAGQMRVLEWIATDRSVTEILAELLAVAGTHGGGIRSCLFWSDSDEGGALRCVTPGFTSAETSALAALGAVGGPVVGLLGDRLAGGEGPEARTGSPPAREVMAVPLAGPLESAQGLVFPIRSAGGRAHGAVMAVLPRGTEPRRDVLDLQRLTASLAGVALERHLADAGLRGSAERLRTANAALLSLARSEAVATGELGRAFEQICEAGRGGLGLARVSIWLFGEGDAELRCAHPTAAGSDAGKVDEVLQVLDHPAYFEAVARNRFVSIADVGTDPRALDLRGRYLSPLGITSLLDAGIRLGGRLVGIICLEHKGVPRAWRSEEELFAGSLADVAALALQASQRRLVEEALRQSEEAYRSVVGILAEGVMVINRDGAVVTSNDSALKLLGWTPGHLERSRLQDAPWQTAGPDGGSLPPEAHPASQTLRTGQPVTDHVLGLRRQDGRVVWLSFNTRVFARDDELGVSSVLVSFADITRRQAAEQELRFGHELLRAISDVQAQFIADGNAGPTFTQVLQSLLRMTGSEAAAMAELVPRSDASPVVRVWATAGRQPPAGFPLPSGVGAAALPPPILAAVLPDLLATGGPVTTRSAGDSSYLLGIPLRLDEAVVGVVVLARRERAYDLEVLGRFEPLWITCANLCGAIRTERQRQEAEARIRQLNTELERRVQERTADLRATNEELAEFAYVVTHDLKAPLRGIHQLAEWLTDEHASQLDPEGLHLLDLLRQRVRRLQRLVDGLLDCARVGRSPEEEGEVSVAEVVRDVLGVLAPPPRIVIEVPDELPVIRANPDRLHQIFQNLLDNAVKYLDKPEGRIAIGASRLPHAWEFRVADNGPGIPERYRGKVFHIFQRLHTESDVPGSGLGLTVVKRIIESRGGRIWIEPADEAGTTMRFTWPDAARQSGVA